MEASQERQNERHLYKIKAEDLPVWGIILKKALVKL
jgi:hypothetical protein